MTLIPKIHIGIISKSRHFDGGRGTIDKPYRIVKLRHLNNMKRYPSAHYVLLNDIIFTDEFEEGGEYYNDGKGWIPIQNFYGTLDGQGFKIENLRRTETVAANFQGGFINYMQGASQLKNLYFKDLYVNCPAFSNAGGVVGWQATGNINSVIEKVFVDGYVRLSTRVGGVVGRNCRMKQVGANLTCVFAQVAGGLVGGSSSWQYLDDCYVRGSMSAYNHRACVHGSTFGARIYRTWSDMLLTGGAGHLKRGIISAYDGYGGASWDCYWDMNASTAYSSNNYNGGLTVGLTTAQSKYPYPAYNEGGDQGYAGWDFENIWAHDTDGTINDGYPYLRGVTPIL